MKLFLKIFAGLLIFMECFIFLGGFVLIDFHSSPYLTGAVWAFLPSFFVYALWRLSDHIEELEKRVRDLEEDKRNRS